MRQRIHDVLQRLDAARAEAALGKAWSRSPYKNDLLDGTKTTDWPGERCTEVFVAGKSKDRTCTKN